MKVGVLGGSFDPPHKGHIHISLQALKALGLDQVWWLLSPQNPLKMHRPKNILERVALCETLIHHPKIRVKTYELEFRTNFTSQTLMRLKQKFPGCTFVWLMGADNLVSFHTWTKWTRIIEQNHIAVFPRPGFNAKAFAGVTAQRYRDMQLPQARAHELTADHPPRWVFLRHSMVDISSTRLRGSFGKLESYPIEAKVGLLI